jgi:hypothetical protein
VRNALHKGIIRLQVRASAVALDNGLVRCECLDYDTLNAVQGWLNACPVTVQMVGVLLGCIAKLYVIQKSVTHICHSEYGCF